MNGQMSLFAEQTTSEEQFVQDVRTKHQEDNKVSYDVGEKIGGAKKDIYTLKENFQSSHNKSDLRLLEEADKSSAAELITKEELFKDFTMQNEKDNGVAVNIARFKQLMIRRIDKSPSDSETSRTKYFHAALCLNEKLSTVKNRDDLSKLVKWLNHLLIDEMQNEDLVTRRLQNAHDALNKYDKDDNRWKRGEEEFTHYQEMLDKIELAKTYSFSYLGKSFRRMFTNNPSLRSSLDTANKMKSWDDVLSPTKKDSKPRKKSKPVWERNLPERPDRHGGEIVRVERPEDLKELVNLKGVQFGHYVEDKKAKEHIFRCTEAIYDLADMLQIDQPSYLSLDGMLSLAFGARGTGRALGHYEPMYRVINFTKEKGSLGILAHEWFHALDNYIGSLSNEFSNGKAAYLSESHTLGDNISTNLKESMQSLLSSITGGDSVEVGGKSMEYTSNKNKNVNYYSYTIPSRYKKVYYQNSDNDKVDMEAISKDLHLLYEEQKEFYQGYGKVDDKNIKKIDKQYEKTMQAMAWLHEKETGEHISYLPIVSNYTQFFNRSVRLDRGSKGKYWSSTKELTARVFEAYIEDKLRQDGRKSDYLVCGTSDTVAYPTNKEREEIFEQMDNVIQVIQDEIFK